MPSAAYSRELVPLGAMLLRDFTLMIAHRMSSALGSSEVLPNQIYVPVLIGRFGSKPLTSAIPHAAILNS